MDAPDAGKKTALVSQRVPKALKERLKAIKRDHGVGEALLLTDALEAVCDFVEERKKYERPIVVLPAAKVAHFLAAAEPGQGHYHSGPGKGTTEASADLDDPDRFIRALLLKASERKKSGSASNAKAS